MFFHQDVPLIIDGTEFNVKVDGLNAHLETDKYLIRLSSLSDKSYSVSAFVKQQNTLRTIIEDVRVNSINHLSLLIESLNKYKQPDERE